MSGRDDYWFEQRILDAQWAVDAERVAGMTSPVRCTLCRRVYDLGAITDYGRYTDCTVWKCPGCKVTVSDRPHAWGHDHHFEELDHNGHVTRRNY